MHKANVVDEVVEVALVRRVVEAVQKGGGRAQRTAADAAVVDTVVVNDVAVVVEAGVWRSQWPWWPQQGRPALQWP